MTPYVVSKWGVRALARQLQIENREHSDLHISYVAPGGVDTPIWSQAANFARSAGRPPPFSDDPAKVARVVLARMDKPRAETQVGPLNDVLRFGFSFLPGVYDRIISPALRVLARDQDQGRADDAGNVLEPSPEGEQSRGGYGGTLSRVGRQLAPRGSGSGS
jgi:short-subunit dehydrogenase